MTPLLTVSIQTVLIPSLSITLVIFTFYVFLFRSIAVKLFRNWRNSKRAARMPDLYQVSGPLILKELPIGESAIVSKSAVSVDKTGRVWLRRDERLFGDELTAYSAWHLVKVERTAKDSWELTLPIVAGADLPKFERSKTFWSVNRYLPVTEIREMQIEPELSKFGREN